ncbi:MAG TPA: Dna2/Cas4 domain-containing protein, partial [Herpetosiphonaceae bacterium]
IWRGRRLRAAAGLPWRQVVYQDTERRTLAKPLFSQRHGLAGQPDYILRDGAGWMPVEVKPTRRDQTPRTGDLLQLAAYCLLLEEATGRPPARGLLRYQSATFEMIWDNAWRQELLDTLAAMRDDLAADDVPRTHDEPRRCRACGFADRCEDSLWSN